MNMTRIAAAVVLAIATSGVAAAELTDAAQWLDQAEAATRWVQRSRTLTEITYTMVIEGDLRLRGANSVEQYRDGDGRARLNLVKQELERTDEYKPSSTPERQEHILADGRHVLHFVGAKVQLAKSAPNIQRWENTLRADPKLGGYLDGWVPFGGQPGRTIFDLSRRGSVKLETALDIVEGLSCQKISASTNNLHILLWVAPARGGALAKFALEGSLPGEFAEFRVTAGPFTFRQVENVWVISGGRFRGAYRPEGAARPYSFDVSATRREIDLKPVFGGDVFSTKHIKDGLPCLVEEEIDTGVRSVWRAGDIVPDIDRARVEQVRQRVISAHQTGGPTDPFGRRMPVWLRRSLILACASAGAFLLWLMMERWVLPWLRAKRGE